MKLKFLFIEQRRAFKLWFVYRWFAMFKTRYCWADCVVWAYAHDRWNPFKIERVSPCETESKVNTHELCYCGICHKGNKFLQTPEIGTGKN